MSFFRPAGRKNDIQRIKYQRQANVLKGRSKHMETEHAPQTIVALYAALADAESALQALEAAGVPYPATRLAAHTPADIDRANIAERTALAGIRLPDQFWS